MTLTSPLDSKESKVPSLTAECPFFPVEVFPLLVQLLVRDNAWTQATESLGRWMGNALAQGFLHRSSQKHSCQHAEYFDHRKHFRQGEHCICVGNGLAMSALYPEMRLHQNQELHPPTYLPTNSQIKIQFFRSDCQSGEPCYPLLPPPLGSAGRLSPLMTCLV